MRFERSRWRGGGGENVSQYLQPRFPVVYVYAPPPPSPRPPTLRHRLVDLESDLELDLELDDDDDDNDNDDGGDGGGEDQEDDEVFEMGDALAEAGKVTPDSSGDGVSGTALLADDASPAVYLDPLVRRKVFRAKLLEQAVAEGDDGCVTTLRRLLSAADKGTHGR